MSAPDTAPEQNEKKPRILNAPSPRRRFARKPKNVAASPTDELHAAGRSDSVHGGTSSTDPLDSSTKPAFASSSVGLLVQQDDSGPQPDHLQEVKDFMHQFVVAEKNYQLYPSYSKVVKASNQKLFDSLQRFLKQAGEPLQLRVNQKDFLFESAVVYHEEHTGRSLAYRLYTDDVRAVAFLEDIEISELIVRPPPSAIGSAVFLEVPDSQGVSTTP